MSETFAIENVSLLSHKQLSEKLDIDNIESRLKASSDLVLPLQQELDLLHGLNDFELGRFLLQNKGLNGYWTSYLISQYAKMETVNAVEKWLLQSAPGVLASRERFHVFQKELQGRLHNGMQIASIPCGLMDDLLTLDYSGLSSVDLMGIDLDQSSLDMAVDRSASYQTGKVTFVKKDAWQLGITNHFDIITSNGLNIYEPDDAKVEALYASFYKALKPTGELITSFITPPPMLSTNSTWKNFISEDVVKQKAIFTDIIQANWQCYRGEALTRDQLKAAGFSNIQVIYDAQGIFPTVIATK